MEMKNENRFRKFLNKNKLRRNQLTKRDEFKDLLIYLVFVFVTTIVATSSREIGMFYFNNTIERLFSNRITVNKQGLQLTYEDIITISDWWSFAETTFIDGISQIEEKMLLMNVSTDGNVLFGTPRLRQIRVKSEPCKIDKILQNNFEACFGPYMRSREDHSPFLNKTHSSQTEANTYEVSGTITNYHGGGYIELLDLHREENENILDQLRNASWVDAATRVIVIEFVLYNSNVNIFCNAKFLAEISPTGGVVTSNQLQALRYFALWNHGGYFVMSCSLVFIGLVIYYAVTMTSGAVVKGFAEIYKSLFNILQVLVLLIACSTVIYVAWHTFFIKSMLKRYDQENNQFISLDIICYWNGKFIDLMGVCVFIVWIQVFKYVKFNKTMMQFSTTLQRCAKDLLGFSIMFAIIFAAFALLATMVFGAVHSGFCTFSEAVLTLMRTVLGDFDFEKLEAANRFLGPIFFVSFILFVFFILMNMFLAIINDTYSDVKSDTTDGSENQLKIDEEEPKVSPITNQQNNMSYEDQELKKFNSIIDKYFEVISTNTDDDNVKDSLGVRVTILEEKMEKILSYLSEILKSE